MRITEKETEKKTSEELDTIPKTLNYLFCQILDKVTDKMIVAFVDGFFMLTVVYVVYSIYRNIFLN